MDLICPNCSRRLTIEDRYAGMVVKCPLCSGMLQAPALMSHPADLPSAEPIGTAPPPMLKAGPPAAPPNSLPVGMPNLSLDSSAPTTDIIPPLPSSLSAPPMDIALPTGEYTKRFRVHLRPDILEWIPPACAVLIFFLSFFNWAYPDLHALNLWELAFSQRGKASCTFYTVVMIFLAFPLTIVTLILQKRWLPMPPGLVPLWPWRTLIVGGVVTLPYLFFVGAYVSAFFEVFGNPTLIAMKLAFRAHLIAVIAYALQFWLELRRPTNRPLPRVEIRW